ncbi:MAG TPA: alpha/beta fold hydrolase, partial [Thermoanaerobaculia bacterium]|nr:alpha/beta fold hydrolase [Thermoanaerobaculia bacterium]
SVAPVVEAMMPKMLTHDAPEDMRERVLEIMNSSSTEGVIAALEAMATRADSSDLLPKIAVPTLVVVGAEDTITPPTDAQRMARLIPNATYVEIPGAAHLSNYEKWERFNHAVVSFTTSENVR